MSNNLKGFIETSHLANQQHYCRFKRQLTHEELQKFYDPGSIDAFLSFRQLQCLEPLFKHFADKKWLTVGDGRMGKEAFFIQAHGQEVLPTDMDPRILEQCRDLGVFSDVRQENAEKLSFEDDSFDFVFCKEMLHHLPRPYLAMYEMFRVSRICMAFIEPSDPKIPMSAAFHTLLERERELSKLYGKEDQEPFEECGNYAYKLSPREIEKFALGLGLKWVAYRGINVINKKDMPSFEMGVKHRVDDNSPFATEYNSRQISLDFLCESGFERWGSYAYLVFTVEELPEGLKTDLKGSGWTLKELPQNPYHQVNVDRAEAALKQVN